MRPRTISVIIPTYNRTLFLEEAIASILSQTRAAAEVIVVDDGSDPPFKRDLQRLARRDPRIAVHALSEHRGVSAARNRGLDLARGDYLLFLDDDDLLPPALFEEAGAELDMDASLAGVVCSYQPRYERPIGIERRAWLRFDYRKEGARLRTDPFNVFLRSCPAIHTTLLRREMVKDQRFEEDLTYGEDWYYWLTAAFRGCQFKLRSDLNVCYRRHVADTSARGDLTHARFRFLRKVEESGMLHTARDSALLHVRAAHCLWQMGDWQVLARLRELIRYPRWLWHYAVGAFVCRLRPWAQ